MKFKVAFLSGAYRTITADCFTVDERFLVFVKGGNPVLTAVLDNVLFFDPTAETEPAGPQPKGADRNKTSQPVRLLPFL
jgi:hypothetical protein